MAEYIIAKNRVRQAVGDVKIPVVYTNTPMQDDKKASSFDDVIQYFQDLKEEWEPKVGKQINVYDIYCYVEGNRAIRHRKTEPHVFDVFYIAEYYDDNRNYVAKVVGERDMTESEIAHYNQEDRDRTESRRKQFEELRDEFGEK